MTEPVGMRTVPLAAASAAGLQLGTGQTVRMRPASKQETMKPNQSSGCRDGKGRSRQETLGIQSLIKAEKVMPIYNLPVMYGIRVLDSESRYLHSSPSSE